MAEGNAQNPIEIDPPIVGNINEDEVEDRPYGDIVEIRIKITELCEVLDHLHANNLLVALEKTRRQLISASLMEERVIKNVNDSFMSMTPTLKNIVNASSNLKSNERFIREGIIQYKTKRGFDEYDKDHVLLNGLENIRRFFRHMEYVFELKGGFIFETTCTSKDRLSQEIEDKLGERHTVGEEHYTEKLPLVVCCNNQSMFETEVLRLLKSKNHKNIMAGVCPRHYQGILKQPSLCVQTSLLVGSFRYIVVGVDFLKDKTMPTVFL